MSTQQYSIEYLQSSWENRPWNNTFVRKGFGQFFYCTCASHLEYVLGELADIRLQYMNACVLNMPDTISFGKSDRAVQEQHTKLFKNALMKMVESYIVESDRNSLQSRLETYNMLFEDPFTQVIGSDRYKDFEALRDLRNLYSHGRNIELKATKSNFLDPENFTGFDGSLCKKAVELLRNKGIISKKSMVVKDIHLYYDGLFENNSLLYFYEATKNIQNSLIKSANNTDIEKMYHGLIETLPNLTV